MMHGYKEWSQILYNDFGILSVDIELPKETYDEGRRGDRSSEDYHPERVRKDFGTGELETSKRSFYDLLETYSDVISEYIKEKNNLKKVAQGTVE